MDAKALFGLLAVALSTYNIYLYVRSVFRGKTRPHAFTWGIWALTSAITFFAQESEGAGPGAWLQGVNAFTCSFVMLLALRRGDRAYARADWAALLFCLASIPLWVATGTPLWSVLLLCAIDGAGFLPTFRKSWSKPFEEPPFPYILWGLGALVSFGAMEAYTPSIILYPVFLAWINFVFAGMVVFRRKQIPS